MDQGPLVDNQIDDGFKLVKQLGTTGFDVAAAFWVRTSEDGQWTLYIASKVVEESGTAAAYRKVADALRQLEDPWVSMSEVKVIGEKNPITTDVLAILRKHPGPMATRSRRPTLGDIETDEVYVYPAVEGAIRRPPNVRIIGVKKVTSGTETRDVQEEVGQVEGFIGEPEFNTKFTALIRSKFGSPEQFAATYPRVILQEE
jgi:hypothetical protein